MICDHLHNAVLYANLHPGLKKGLSLLADSAILSLPDGRHLVDGERLIAMPQRYDTRLASAGKWESHRRYIDIQYILQGEELMGWANKSRLTVTEPYDPARDVACHQGTGSLIHGPADYFAIFYPEDAHMPCLAVNDRPSPVRKIVLKVALGGEVSLLPLLPPVKNPDRTGASRGSAGKPGAEIQGGRGLIPYALPAVAAYPVRVDAHLNCHQHRQDGPRRLG
jgi:YhcH/YjgK/YiaL family protein